jgi:hypothetical protein
VKQFGQLVLFVWISCFFAAFIPPVVAQQRSVASTSTEAPSGAFSDVTERLGVNFYYQASHTSKKYL